MPLKPHWVSFSPTTEKPRVAWPDEPVMRPLLDVRLIGPGGRSARPTLLVDSGSEYTLVSQVFARRIGASLDGPTEQIRIGGRLLPATIGEVVLEVEPFPPVEVIVGWTAKWPFETSHVGVLGQRGFHDRYLVLMDRVNLRFGIVSQEASDAEFPPPPLSPDPTPSMPRMPFSGRVRPRIGREFNDSPDG